MHFNGRLLTAIRDRGLNQKKFALLVGDHPSKVSRVITGRWNLGRHEKERYALALGEQVDQIFRDN